MTHEEIRNTLIAGLVSMEKADKVLTILKSKGLVIVSKEPDISSQGEDAITTLRELRKFDAVEIATLRAERDAARETLDVARQTLITLSSERDAAREALAELLEVLKIHKAHFFEQGWTRREREELMEAMHKGNVAMVGKQ